MVWLLSIPIRGYLLEQCPVAMTLIPLLVTNGDFLFTIRVWDSSRFVTIQFETAALLYLQVWDWSHFGTSTVYKFGTGLVLVLYKSGLKF